MERTDFRFDDWFAKFSGGVVPHDWQRGLAAGVTPRSRLIRIPTGMGKTMGVLAAWAWHRVHQQDSVWPRRLVWCLPMRVLVEQTLSVARDAIDRLGCLWSGTDEHAGLVGVHPLMGGADAGGEWNLYPEDCAILIGTQDMLLSRALNRGYASGRGRWPQEFGLLNHDTLWVMDEVQLMDVGLATSAQLQTFLDADASKGFRPRSTWWMSATLQPSWLESVDTVAHYEAWIEDPVTIPQSIRRETLGGTVKRLSLASVEIDDARELASMALRAHSKLTDSGHGRITLVVCNIVDRACDTADAIRTLAPSQEVELVHSRFRQAERAGWKDRFLSRAACVPGANRIIVATQVIEAGVDISAGCVITETAPWPSLVQRFGRCARYGGNGTAIVVDRGRNERNALPYSVAEIDAAWNALARIVEGAADVGTAALEEFEAGLEDTTRAGLYPYEPKHLLLRHEYDELFDTTPDLTGADVDISRFIRSGDEKDLQVFWLEIPPPRKKKPAPEPDTHRRPRREELCAIKFLDARDWLCGEETKTKRKPTLRSGIRAWVWDWVDGEWKIASRATLTPGRIVCVSADSGGYLPDRGFTPKSTRPVPVVPLVPLSAEEQEQADADASDGNDAISQGEWETISCHCSEVSDLAVNIGDRVGLPENLGLILRIAGRWHDLGKAHPAFQGAIVSDDRPDREDLAKAPDKAWRRPYRTRDGKDFRTGLRHELASALALFAVLRRHQPQHPALLGPWAEAFARMGQSMLQRGTSQDPPAPAELEVMALSASEFDLLAYLVAAHHGKVRVSLHAAPKDQDYRDPGDGRGLPIRGVREGDVLPSVALIAASTPLPPLTLTLQPATLGLSPETGRSWRDRTLDLTDHFGPATLAWLEALLVAADRRASRLQTADPALAAPEATR